MADDLTLGVQQEGVTVAIELTPELIAICVSFVGLLIGFLVGFGAIAGRLIKIGRWMERVDNRLENLEKGQVQILAALQNHIHGPDGAPPLFYAPVPQPPSPSLATPPLPRAGETEAPT